MSSVRVLYDCCMMSSRLFVGFVQDCNKYIYENFTYSKGITTIETTVDEIMEIRSGVCQDFAHVMLSVRVAHTPPPLEHRDA